MSLPVLSTARTELERNEKYWEPEEVALVVDAFEKKALVAKRRLRDSVVVAAMRPSLSVARRALVSPVSHVLPVFVNCVVLARVLFNRPTTVEEACEPKPLPNVPRPRRFDAPLNIFVPVVMKSPTIVDELTERKPLTSVESPETLSVEENEPVPAVSEPIVDVFEKLRVDEDVCVKKLVVVAAVPVMLPNVKTPVASSYDRLLAPPRTPPSLNCICPSDPPAATPPLPTIQLPSIAKQPSVRLTPCAKVDVAVPETFRELSERPPENVEVPLAEIFKSPVSVPPEIARYYGNS